jgi:predicted anti-sigma-YlaC factor YlaD
MSNEPNEQTGIGCREARKRFADLDERGGAAAGLNRAGQAETSRHLERCSRCASEYRLFSLQRATLNAAAAPEPVIPGEDFFKAVRARIARGPELSPSRRADESWASALLLTARQLIPAMAVLVLLIIGATLLWNQAPSDTSQAAVRPGESVVFSDIYDYPAPTRDDVLETLVAVEEK